MSIDKIEINLVNMDFFFTFFSLTNASRYDILNIQFEIYRKDISVKVTSLI